MCSIERWKRSQYWQIISDHEKEFENANFVELCDRYGITHEFSTPITPEQNKSVERKNRKL